MLDLMLPEMDGLSLIQAAGPGRVPPVVLLTSPYYNGYILEAVEALHISFAMRRPCGIESVVMRLDDLCSRRGRQAGLAFVEDHLRSLEFNQPLLGSRMLPLTVVLFARDPDQSITKEVYPEVARQWGQGAAWRKVEKDIRYAIDTAWANGNKEAWAQHLRLDHKPSNKEFIARMAELLNAWRTE